jgi:50S ribosomal subunit-associated GTPase HflX
MADSTLTAAERAKLEQRRERLMKLLQEGSGMGSGETLDADDRRDLEQEWHKIDQELNRR